MLFLKDVAGCLEQSALDKCFAVFMDSVVIDIFKNLFLWI